MLNAVASCEDLYDKVKVTKCWEYNECISIGSLFESILDVAGGDYISWNMNIENLKNWFKKWRGKRTILANSMVMMRYGDDKMW